MPASLFIVVINSIFKSLEGKWLKKFLPSNYPLCCIASEGLYYPSIGTGTDQEGDEELAQEGENSKEEARVP